jgi:hypothetical protein
MSSESTILWTIGTQHQLQAPITPITRMQGNSPHQKNNNQIEDLVGKEENEYLVPDPNRTMINITNMLSGVHKKIYQRGNHGQAY